MKLRAGAATSNITPRLGISINGGMADRQAEQIHDELHARCLVLDDGRIKIAMVVCDSCMIPAEVLNAAKHVAHEKTGIPPDRILISATHAHSAPSAASVFQSDADAEYQEFLALRIADGIQRANKLLRPAKLAFGTGSLDSVVFNRRWKMTEDSEWKSPFGQREPVKMNPPVGATSLVEPIGPIDPTVTVLAVQDANEKPLAVWANYSLHYVGGVPGTDVSADYFGAFCDTIQERLQADRQDPPFVGMLTNGASGDVNNINFRTPWAKQPPYGQIRFVAGLLAAEVQKVYSGLAFRDEAALAMVERRIRLGVRKPNPVDLAEAEKILRRSQGPSLRGVEEIYARETLLLKAYPEQIDTSLQVVSIGGLALAAIPCEVFVEVGLAVRKASPFPTTCTVSLANDYHGYLPTAEQHALGGYETWRARSSYLETGAAEKIQTQLAAMFQELKRRQAER